jgi:hypothetical protein
MDSWCVVLIIGLLCGRQGDWIGLGQSGTATLRYFIHESNFVNQDAFVLLGPLCQAGIGHRRVRSPSKIYGEGSRHGHFPNSSRTAKTCAIPQLTEAKRTMSRYTAHVTEYSSEGRLKKICKYIQEHCIQKVNSP